MKVYLSYSMTDVTEDEAVLRRVLIRQIRGAFPEREFYDPEADEPGGLSMPQIQDHDFEQMADCDGLLVLWGPTTVASGGVAAEVEWAWMMFGMPIVICAMSPRVHVPTWTKARADRVMCGNWFIAMSALNKLMLKNARDERCQRR